MGGIALVILSIESVYLSLVFGFDHLLYFRMFAQEPPSRTGVISKKGKRLCEHLFRIWEVVGRRFYNPFLPYFIVGHFFFN